MASGMRNNYLTMMVVRLFELRRVVKPTGWVYLAPRPTSPTRV